MTLASGIVCGFRPWLAYMHAGLHQNVSSDVLRSMTYLSLSLTHCLFSHSSLSAEWGLVKLCVVYSPGCWVLGLLAERLHSVTSPPSEVTCVCLFLWGFTFTLVKIKQFFVRAHNLRPKLHLLGMESRTARKPNINRTECISCSQNFMCACDWTTLNVRGLSPHWVKLLALTVLLGACTV